MASATPPLSLSATTRDAAAFTDGTALPIATPTPARVTIPRSLLPSPMATRSLAEAPQCFSSTSMERHLSQPLGPTSAQSQNRAGTGGLCEVGAGPAGCWCTHHQHLQAAPVWQLQPQHPAPTNGQHPPSMSGTACIVSASVPASAACQCGFRWPSTACGLVMKRSLRSAGPASTCSMLATDASGS